MIRSSDGSAYHSIKRHQKYAKHLMIVGGEKMFVQAFHHDFMARQIQTSIKVSDDLLSRPRRCSGEPFLHKRGKILVCLNLLQMVNEPIVFCRKILFQNDGRWLLFLFSSGQACSPFGRKEGLNLSDRVRRCNFLAREQAGFQSLGACERKGFCPLACQDLAS